MKNMKNGDLLHTLTNLDEELNNAVDRMRCGYCSIWRDHLGGMGNIVK